MKKILLLFTIVFFNTFAWETYKTESGGIGIYQDCVAGAESGRIAIFKENNKYNLIFITSKYEIQPYDYELGRVWVNAINDLGQGDNFITSAIWLDPDGVQFGFKDDYKKFLTNSKWVKFTIPISNGANRVFKFDFSGFNKLIDKIK